MTHARALTALHEHRSTLTVLPDDPTIDRTTAPTNRTTAVVGLGYVGLPTALSLAEADHDVIGVDVSTERLAAIRAGTVDLLPADHERLARHRDDDRLRLTDDASALQRADVVLICVPTPVDDHLGPDLTALRGACATVVANATPGQTIVLTSTTYVGCTHELLVEPLATERGLVGSSRVDLQACKLEYSIVSPK